MWGVAESRRASFGSFKIKPTAPSIYVVPSPPLAKAPTGGAAAAHLALTASWGLPLARRRAIANSRPRWRSRCHPGAGR